MNYKEERLAESETAHGLHITQKEIDFFTYYAQGRGGLLALAVARRINSPFNNVFLPGEQTSVRQNKLVWSSEPAKDRPRRAELGGFEYSTALIMARQFHKIIESAKGTIRGDVVINVIDNNERKFITLDEYKQRLENSKEHLRIVGVIASIEGDDPTGASILVRSDMDALQMGSSEIKHQCGHNVHSGWAVMNLQGMVGYKREFQKLPFKKLVFVSEANEEANPGAGEQVSPQEMLKTGFADKYGKMDLVLGAHVMANIPEETVRLEEAGFSGANDFIFEVKSNKNYNPATDADIRLLPYEVARLVNKEFNTDEPNPKFGKRQLVEDDGSTVPPIYVRLTAMQAQQIDGGYENLKINSLAAECEYTGKLVSDKISEAEIRNILDRQIQKWKENGFELYGSVELETNTNRLTLNIQTAGEAHVAFGGPNPRQIMGEVLDQIRQASQLLGVEDVSGLQFGGTMRIRMPDYEQVEGEVSESLKKIYAKAIENLRLVGKIDLEYRTQNSVAPVINNSELVSQARKLFNAANVLISRVTVPNAGAESFAAYRDFLNNPQENNLLYILIGGMERSLAKELLANGKPVPQGCIHHSDDFVVQASAIPYGIALSALVIQLARDWKINNPTN